MDKAVHTEPSDVAAENGTVLLDGPGGVVVSLTPEAAIETSDRLLECGTRALGQRLIAEREAKELAARRIDDDPQPKAT